MEKNSFYEQFIGEINNEIARNDNKICVAEEDSLLDLGIDSLGFLKLIVFIETKYSIEFEEEYLSVDKFQSIGDLTDYVWRQINKTV